MLPGKGKLWWPEVGSGGRWRGEWWSLVMGADGKNLGGAESGFSNFGLWLFKFSENFFYKRRRFSTIGKRRLTLC